ncbi:16350_t:CDS:1, partial [Rhizophagus irregularis]
HHSQSTFIKIGSSDKTNQAIVSTTVGALTGAVAGGLTSEPLEPWLVYH